MLKSKSYYDILGISPSADRETIIAAIAKLRKKETYHSYISMLDNIEYILCDAHKKAEYDKFLKVKGIISKPININKKTNQKPAKNIDFKKPPVAQTQSTSQLKKQIPKQTAKSLTHIPYEHKSFKQITSPNQSINALAAPQKPNLKTKTAALSTAKIRDSETVFFNARSYRKLFSLIITLLFITGLAWLGNKAYIRWQVFQQTNQAVESLKQASQEIENYIRVNYFFPEQIPTTFQASPYYALHLEGKNIVLTFSNQAAATLPNTQLKMLSRNVPKLGLAWQCAPAENFPIQYLPQKCY